MNYDLLLAYLTELGTGDWTQFRRAVEFVSDEDQDTFTWSLARRLSMLGHVEFAFNSDLHWTVCPPTLAWLPHRDKLTAVLCGARDRQLMQQLYAHAREFGIQVETVEQREGPAAIFLTASSRDIDQQLVGRIENLASEWNAAGRMAQCLPPLDSYTQHCVEASEPSGYDMQVFDANKLDWVEVARTGSEGLYQYDCYRFEYRLKLDGRCLKTSREIGIFLWLRRQQRTVIRYDHTSQNLLASVHTPLPDLFARVATLASGLLPEFEYVNRVPTHVYRAVPANIAQTILKRLDQTAESQP